MFHARALLLLAVPAILSAQVTVPALAPQELTQILKSGRWTVIVFGGPTCIPCRRMQPILANLQLRFGERAQIRNFYVTEHPEQAREHQIMTIPTQVVFDPNGLPPNCRPNGELESGVWVENQGVLVV